MGIIHILDAQTANMIAAGEVVDRPASALKELLENALDAGATRVSVEIKGGGRAFLRVTDNGKGFLRDDMPKALLRHATSKLRDGNDLNAIPTFGFRGEALAAVSSVSRIEIISKSASEEIGTRLTGDENGVVMTDTGCPDGTTVIVRDLFYNTPARQKFLKRDATEASACVTAAEHAAISHPEVSFTVSVEGTRRFFTAGDGKLLPALHAIYGKGFTAGLLPADYTLEGVRVRGYICKPDEARGSRSMQMFYVNSRPVRSKTMTAALEEAYRSYLPHGKFPSAVLFAELSCGLTDVNVHPAKLEIRFADEKKVFSAVYYAVKNVLSGISASAENAGAAEPSPESGKPAPSPENAQNAHGANRVVPHPEPGAPGGGGHEPFRLTVRELPEEKPGGRVFVPNLGEEDLVFERSMAFFSPGAGAKKPDGQTAQAGQAGQIGQAEPPEQAKQLAFDARPYWKYIGEAYNAFLFVETEKEVLMIDKHAAHERILYERLASRKEVHSQELLSGIPVDMTPGECASLCENAAYLEQFGFRVEPFGGGTLLVRAVPSTLAGTKELRSLLETFAAELNDGGSVPFSEKCDRALFTVACKAAVKAGIPNDRATNEWIVGELMENEALRYCPHGRPVLHSLPKRELEKYFDR